MSGAGPVGPTEADPGPDPDAHSDRRIIDGGSIDGLTRCPSCGATDIAWDIDTSELRCGFCRQPFPPVSADDVYGINGHVADLEGTVIGAGSTDVAAPEELIRTFECSACGAEIVIDTAHELRARCHWCRNALSVNDQVGNGVVPDIVLPFRLTREEAVGHIARFVGRRFAYAHPDFVAGFDPDNVMGVYLPYMVIDVNARARFRGHGEHETGRFTIGSGNSRTTRYDASVYQVSREFDLYIDDLTVESSTERLNRGLHDTNNIINSIMPFDVENAVCWDANFLNGFTSERRDIDIDELTPLVRAQSTDIARHAARSTTTYYDRGVRWIDQDLTIRGQRWVSAYLPVWLYSHLQDDGDGNRVLHYVAVNGRTGETMGSIPIHRPKLLAVSAIIELVGIAFGLFIIWALLA